ncbi:MAG TPA: hydantoinase B/oxoprolinase family protein [Rhizomicrobium sp.]|jgi:5-oxoprolinase (ATP-hydrolysing)|nr:hydantoinase B/oxoprolinase family protein [Rhizomicrobium sp.]
MSAIAGKWNFYIDRGGTFTDVVAEAPDGKLSTLKLLSESTQYDDAALEGICRALGLQSGSAIPAGLVGEVRMGTTVATNALLTRSGERLVLVTTRGFKDGLRIAYQNRPKLFALKIELPDMLYESVIAADERVGASGAVLRPLDEEALARDLVAARARGILACAIVFLHGYRFPAHEARAAEIARAAGFTQVSTSHEAVPLMKFVSRGDTTVADAYLSPVLGRYTGKIADALKDAKLAFMTSNGGLAAPAFFRGKDAILSGPAGGVVGMAETARAAGFDHVIGFDMGGTSTDVARWGGDYERVYETEVAGVRLRTPMLAIHTVAAGGGSILAYDGARLRAGPASAGANPGPMSYGRGGPLTVTDANVLVGKLRADYFPKIFGAAGDAGLDAAAVRAAFAALGQQAGRAPEELADGFIRIAVENMANAIKRISVAKGYDARDYALACFGGAGGQHSCLVADALGMTTVFIHPLSSLLSAYGMKLAALRSVRQRAVGKPLAGSEAALRRTEQELRRLAEDELIAQGAGLIASSVRVHIRYDGSDTTLPIAYGATDEMVERFAADHARQFGFGFEGRALIAESMEVEARSVQNIPSPPPGETVMVTGTPSRDVALDYPLSPEGRKRDSIKFFSQSAWHDAPVLFPSNQSQNVDGPALIVEPHQTIVVEAGWRAQIDGDRGTILRRVGERVKITASAGDVDPVLLEVFANLFMAIAEEMGVVLQNTATSVNIKERLDFSCAVFDAAGGLVANAPHMPVHLGSMGDCVTAIMARHPTMHDGDAFVTNAPYDGGTHLPDVTVVMPVFVEGALAFYVASRGHHADIGGITPGSMPPFSKDISEEGALFDGIRMVGGGVFDEAALRAVLARGPWPARNPDQNIADLKAQAAACARGADGLRQACAAHGTNVVAAYMRHVQDNAEEAVRRAIGKLSDGAFAMPTDGGAVIRVAVTVDRKTRSARIDFSGTSPQAANNFNAPGSVTKAAVLYVFRCLVDSDIPMNAGCLKPLDIVVPDRSLLKPHPPGAVAAGNVETSQAVVDALFGALGVLAASQGTMNNLTFGNARHQYYETICGGGGAGADFDGQSAVHTHMTNSRLTDPEVLETRYPVLLDDFFIRKGSGGGGAYKGGDGTTRRLRFLEPMMAAILSTRRDTEPFGLAGGAAGEKGRNTLIRKDGSRAALQGCDEIDVAAGDMIEIETPGGGGYGTP